MVTPAGWASSVTCCNFGSVHHCSLLPGRNAARRCPRTPAVVVGRTWLLGCVWFPVRPKGAGADCTGDGWSLAAVFLAGLGSRGSDCRKRAGCFVALK